MSASEGVELQDQHAGQKRTHSQAINPHKVEPQAATPRPLVLVLSSPPSSVTDPSDTSSKKSKVDLKTGGVRAAYKTAPTDRQRPPAKAKNTTPAVTAPPAQIQAGLGGTGEEEGDEGEAEHEQMSKTAIQPKAVSKASKVRRLFHLNHASYLLLASSSCALAHTLLSCIL